MKQKRIFSFIKKFIAIVKIANSPGFAIKNLHVLKPNVCQCPLLESSIIYNNLSR